MQVSHSRTRRARSRNRGGVTVIELLVVIAIIGVLVGLLIPAVQMARAAAALAACQNNLRQIGVALHGFHAQHRKLPPGGSGGVPEGAPEDFPKSLGGRLGFRVYILPYLDQQNLYSQVDLSKNFNESPNDALNIQLVPVYQCPICPVTTNKLDKGTNDPAAHYVGVMGPVGANPQTPGKDYEMFAIGKHGGVATQGVLGVNTQVTMESISDGSSNTLMVGEISWEKSATFRIWTRGWHEELNGGLMVSARNIKTGLKKTTYPGGARGHYNNVSFGSEHAGGGANFVFADGSVRLISETINLDLYKALASRNGGEVASSPE